VHVRDDRDLHGVARILGGLDQGNAEIDAPTRRVSVRVASGSSGLMSAVQSVQAAGVEVEDIAMRQPNLDEVFLALT
jgi:ABC-2 type transport system ATP-binding protein